MILVGIGRWAGEGDYNNHFRPFIMSGRIVTHHPQGHCVTSLLGKRAIEWRGGYNVGEDIHRAISTYSKLIVAFEKSESEAA